MAIQTLRKILNDKHVVVIGSAPLTAEGHEAINKAEVIICVNGSISSIAKTPDIWVLNSRDYNDSLYTDPKRWDDARKQLHEAMMLQTVGKTTRHLVLVKKSRTTEQTLRRLHEVRTKWRGTTEIEPNHKISIAMKAGVKKFSIAFNISAGLLAACLALTNKAKSVTLCGFSFKQEYAYLTDTPPDTRKHIEQDQEAIQDILDKHLDRLTIIFS